MTQPPMTTLLIAGSLADAATHAADMGLVDYIAITPRAPHRARGRFVVAIELTASAKALPAEVLDRLKAEALPGLATTRKGARR